MKFFADRAVRATVAMPSSVDALAQTIRACTLCRLHVGRIHAVPGEGPSDAQILFIGEAPGRQEDAQGRPFVGAAGAILEKALAKAGLSRSTVFITNAVKCRPPKNRPPRSDELATCRPYLVSQIEGLRPRVIVTLGGTALKDLLGVGPTIARARRRPLHYGGIPVIATYHPVASRYDRGLVETITRDLARAAKAAGASRPYIRSGRPQPGKPSRPAHSSGAVVFDRDGRILLLRRADEAIWCLPKGTLEPGETAETAAMREVREEAGLQVEILVSVGEVHYQFYWPPDDVNVDKTVSYFVARRTAGRILLESTFSRAKWCTRSEALRLLHYENDRSVVHAAVDAMARITRRTRGRGRGANS